MKKIKNIIPLLTKQGRPYLEPTEKQREVLVNMLKHFDAVGTWASIKYLSESCSISKTTLYERLQQLIRKGYIYKDGYNSYIIGINAMYYVKGFLGKLKDEEIQ